MSAVDRDRLEVERLMNLVTGFGWVKTKEEVTEDKVVITLEKQRGPVEGGEAGPS